MKAVLCAIGLLLVVGFTLVLVLGGQFTTELYVADLHGEGFTMHRFEGHMYVGVLIYPDYLVIKTGALPALVKVSTETEAVMVLIPPFAEAYGDPYEDATVFKISTLFGTP